MKGIENFGFTRITFTFLTLVLSFFIIAGALATIKKEIIYTGNIGNTIETLETDFLVGLLGSEIPYWGNTTEKKSLISIGFEFVTNIRIGDIRSLIGSELPGYALYDSEIIVAGEGTDFTTIPYESAPPLEELLQEREMAQEQLEELNKGGNSDSPLGSVPTEKSVYIYHTHSWESFLPLLGLTGDPNANKAVDAKTNITLVGDLIGQNLEQQGIGVIVDKTNIAQTLKQNGWGTGKSYDVSRSIVQSAMAKESDLDFFIDIHRDSERREKTTIKIGDKSYARIAFVIGKENKNYEKNTILANELHKILQERYPGISRGIIGKSGEGVDGVYNQDLSPHSIVIEVGGVDNDMKELKNSAAAIAEALSTYYWKAEKVNAKNE